METTYNETTDISVEKTTNSKWNFKQFLTALFRRKRNLEKIENDEPVKINGKLLESVAIHNTPFHAVRFENKWFLTMGKYRLTNQLNNLEECKAEATEDSWIRRMQIMKIMITEHMEEQKLLNTIKQQTEAKQN